MEMEEQRWRVFSNGATLKLYYCWLLRSLDVPVVVVLELVVEMVSDLRMESVPDAHNAAVHDVRRDAVEFFNVPSPIAEPWNVDVDVVVVISDISSSSSTSMVESIVSAASFNLSSSFLDANCVANSERFKVVSTFSTDESVLLIAKRCAARLFFS